MSPRHLEHIYINEGLPWEVFTWKPPQTHLQVLQSNSVQVFLRKFDFRDISEQFLKQFVQQGRVGVWAMGRDGESSGGDDDYTSLEILGLIIHLFKGMLRGNKHTIISEHENNTFF